jgi:hypothetical protein
MTREEDDYSGVRVHVEAHRASASARLPIHADVKVGDPNWPEPTTIACHDFER